MRMTSPFSDPALAQRDAARPPGSHQIPIVVDALAFATLDRLSKAKGQRVTLYAQQLFDAAFAARVGVATGDLGLEAAVNGRGAAAPAGAAGGKQDLLRRLEADLAEQAAAIAGYEATLGERDRTIRTLRAELDRAAQPQPTAPPGALTALDEELLDLRDRVVEQAETIARLTEERDEARRLAEPGTGGGAAAGGAGGGDVPRSGPAERAAAAAPAGAARASDTGDAAGLARRDQRAAAGTAADRPARALPDGALARGAVRNAAGRAAATDRAGGGGGAPPGAGEARCEGGEAAPLCAATTGGDAPALTPAQIKTARGLRAANWTYPMIARQLGLPAAAADAVKAALREAANGTGAARGRVPA